MTSSLRREIRAIAFPAIISNITTPLLAMVDLAIVGHIGAAEYIGAIAVGGSMFNMLYWLFGFLRMGSSGMTAQAYGAGDRRTTDALLFRSLTAGLTAGAVILALGHPLAATILNFMDADGVTSSLARDYFLVAISGAPATLGSFALSGWFLGMQDSRTPMWMALLTNVVNIFTSLILVFGLGLRIEGVAAGSAVAQWCGFGFGIIVALKKYRPSRPTASTVFDMKGLRRFFSVNADIFLRTLCLVAVTVWFTRAGSRQGVEILAVNALLLQLFMFFSYFMDGFAFSGEALAGKYAGRRDSDTLRRLISELMKTGIALAITFGGIYALAGHDILALLTDDDTVLCVSRSYLPWAVIVPIAGTCAFIWDGILIGLTRTRLMLLSMASAMVIFFTIYHFTIQPLANHGLWLAFIAYLAVRGVAEWVLFRLYPSDF